MIKSHGKFLYYHQCLKAWSDIWNTSYIELRIGNQVSYDQQLWTQFKQLRIEALKSQDFNGVWTHWTRWLSTLKALAINANRWYNGFSDCWKCWREALEKSSQSVGRKLQTVETFCAPVGNVEKGVEGVRKSVGYPLISRWFLPVKHKTVSVRFRVKGHI